MDGVLAAAALGRVELVKRFVLSPDRLGPEVSRAAPRWLGLPDDPRAHIGLALVWASCFGRAAVVELLLERGVDPFSHDKDGMTCLHWAAARTHLDIVKLLLRHGARLEVENQWGGTVLDSTIYFARQEAGDGAEYLPVTEALLAAGANVAAVTPFPTGKAALDELLARHGARPG